MLVETMICSMDGELCIEGAAGTRFRGIAQALRPVSDAQHAATRVEGSGLDRQVPEH